MKRFIAAQVKNGWVIYDQKLMRPVSTNIYSAQSAAQAAADRLN